MMAQRRLDIAQQFGGAPAWLAMQTNPGAVGENLARRLAPQTLAEGSSVVTPGEIGGAPEAKAGSGHTPESIGRY
jgi:hypothetical protein